MSYSFAEIGKVYPDGQQNVASLPEGIMEQGFIPAQPNANGQPLPAQWLNWMFQKLWRYVNRDVVTDENGVGLFTHAQSVLTLTAFDPAVPANYIHAIGYKASVGAAHTMVVLHNNVLTLGAAGEDGSQPVLGGTGLVVSGMSRTVGAL